MNRRNLVRAGLSLGALSAVPAAVLAQGANAAQSYPERPIRIVVPYPPGGFNDTLARTLSKYLTADWKQGVVVDNKPGGNTVIGNTAVATAAPDGYTLLITPLPFSVLPALYGAKLPYDAVKSFRPVIWAAYSQNLLVVRKGFPARTVGELVEYARKNPGKVNYASSGSGSSTHLAAELLKSMTKTEMTHIPYKGSAPAVQAVLAGEADLLIDNLPNVTQHVKAGNLLALGVTGKERSALLPDVPTLHESGVPGYEVLVWFGVQAPAGTPEPIVAKLNGQMAKILRQPEVVREFGAQGVEVVASSPEKFTELVKSEISKWGKLVQDARIRVE
jgi:tripartite-type tricarboxylate transporter receptor subunit TctC